VRSQTERGNEVRPSFFQSVTVFFPTSNAAATSVSVNAFIQVSRGRQKSLTEIRRAIRSTLETVFSESPLVCGDKRDAR
jgi:hypothetical protein